MSSNQIVARGLAALFVLACLGAFVPRTPVHAQTTETRYFEETEHNVSGEFLRFFDAYGGRAIFGYPLTRVLTEKGRQVQYFQRARMELDPSQPAGQRVALGKLGVELGYTQPPLSLSHHGRSTIPPPSTGGTHSPPPSMGGTHSPPLPRRGGKGRVTQDRAVPLVPSPQPVLSRVEGPSPCALTPTLSRNGRARLRYRLSAAGERETRRIAASCTMARCLQNPRAF